MNLTTLTALWDATRPVRHAIAGGVVAAITSAYAMSADPLTTSLSTHQWLGLALMFCTGAGLTKYVVPGTKLPDGSPTTPSTTVNLTVPDQKTATAAVKAAVSDSTSTITIASKEN